MPSLLFHKPYGVLSSFTDPEGHETLKAYIPVPGVYAAGRLDYDSEGLLLLTDDGALIKRLTDPRHHLPKTYWVQVEGLITPRSTGSAIERGHHPGLAHPSLPGSRHPRAGPASPPQAHHPACPTLLDRAHPHRR